jgi:hypothetical protein
MGFRDEGYAWVPLPRSLETEIASRRGGLCRVWLISFIRRHLVGQKRK